MAMYVEYSEEKLTLYAFETTKRSRSQIAEQHGIELIEGKPTKITPDALIAQPQPDLIIGDTGDIINYIIDISNYSFVENNSIVRFRKVGF